MGLFSGSRVLGFHWGACLGASSQLKSQPCIFGEYVGLVFLAGHTGVPLVSASRDLGNSVQALKSEIFRPTVPGPHRSSLNPDAPCSQCHVAPRLPPSKAHRAPRLPPSKALFSCSSAQNCGFDYLGPFFFCSSLVVRWQSFAKWMPGGSRWQLVGPR